MSLDAVPFWRRLWDRRTLTLTGEMPAQTAELLAGAEAASAEEVERRAALRHPCHREAWLHPVTLVKHTPYHAIVLDISTCGIAMAIERPVSPGAFFVVELPDPLQNVSRFMKAQIVHVSRKARNYWHVGCVLAKVLSEEELNALIW